MADREFPEEARRAMAVRVRGGKNRETSPERTKVWTEPIRNGRQPVRRVPVIYYLCRNGLLEHPHFMEIPLSSSDGLFLRDVTSRLNVLRGKGIASMYSWSSKRSYKNGFVWHDLSENDFIYPINGHEYVLKGSEIVNCHPPPMGKPFPASLSPKELGQLNECNIEASSSSSDRSGDSGPIAYRKTSNLSEYKVHKPELPVDFPAKAAADASTQTDERKRRAGRREAAELNAEEMSPPPSLSSPSSGTTDTKDPTETLEAIIKEDGSRLGSFRTAIGSPEDELSVRMVNHARVKASAMLMQLISCGSVLVNRSRPHREPRSGPIGDGTADPEYCLAEKARLKAKIRLEDKEYFSGSFLETQKDPTEGVARLQRSNSYNADRADRSEEEADGVRAKCIPIKGTRVVRTKEGSSATVSRSGLGSKRITDEPTKGRRANRVTADE